MARLEDKVGECQVDIGVLQSQVSDVKVQLSDGIDLLSQKMDDVSSSYSKLSDRLGEIEMREKVRGRIVKIALVALGMFGSAAGFILKALIGG